MEMIFQINTRYNCLVGNTNNIDNEYHYTINQQTNQLQVSQSIYTFNQAINESNLNMLNCIVNKHIKERDEFNVIYLGNDSKEILGKTLNDIITNKSLIKEVKYSIEEYNVKEDKMIDILNNKEIHSIKELIYNSYSNNIEITELKKDTMILINCKIIYINTESSIDCSFIFMNLNKDTLDILPLFTVNYSNKNSMSYLLCKIDSLLTYQNSLSEKISSLPLLSSETLQNISSYKIECINYYSSIIENFEEFKNEICSSSKKESTNGQNLSEQFDNFIKSQNDLIDKIKKNDEHNLYSNELNAYKNLIDYYVLKETEEMEKGNENGEKNISSYYENLKDLLYRYIDSNEEISRFITRYKSTKEKDNNKEKYNGLNKIIDNSDKEEIQKLNQQIVNLIETIKTKDNMINNLKSIKRNSTQLQQQSYQQKPSNKVYSIDKRNHFSILHNNPYEGLTEDISSKFRKTDLICNDLYKEYIELCKSYTKYREKVLQDKKNKISKQNKIIKRPDSPTKSIKHISNDKDKTISSLKKTITDHEKMISSLRQELEYMKVKYTKLTKENEQLSEKIKVNKIMSTPSPKKEHNLDKSNEINTSVIDTQRKNNKSQASTKLTASINPNSLMLLNRIKKDNQLIAQQLDFFNKQNAQLQNDLMMLKYNNSQEQSSQIGEYINNSNKVKKNLCNSPRTQKKSHKKGHSMFSSSSVTSVKSTGMNNNSQHKI